MMLKTSAFLLWKFMAFFNRRVAVFLTGSLTADHRFYHRFDVEKSRWDFRSKDPHTIGYHRIKWISLWINPEKKIHREQNLMVKPQGLEKVTNST